MAVFRVGANIFVLETESFQYVLGVGSDGLLRHLHWGEKVQAKDFEIEVLMISIPIIHIWMLSVRNIRLSAEKCSVTVLLNVNSVTEYVMQFLLLKIILYRITP